MSEPTKAARRALLRELALGLSLTPLLLARARSADAPFVSEKDPLAVSLKYTEDASHAAGAQGGSNCSNCALFTADGAAPQGKCSLFPGKLVKAGAWCTSWSTL